METRALPGVGIQGLAAEGEVLALVLFAALLHASWNAVAQSSRDPELNIAIVTGTGGLLAAPFLFVLPLPDAETWRWLGLSMATHLAYQLGLARMYRMGELSQVYPIARGFAPLGVAVLGALFAGEGLRGHQVAGLLLSGTAIVVLGRSGARGGGLAGAVPTALVVALLIGLYTFSDGFGVRTVEQPMHYIAWSFVLGAVPMDLYVAWKRRHTGFRDVVPEVPRAVAGGLMATLGYGIALWAMARAPMAVVASLRESSVLFAALIGAFLLRESLGRVRVLAATALLVGLVLVQLA